jgi:hypothetical protein
MREMPDLQAEHEAELKPAQQTERGQPTADVVLTL